MNGFQSAFYTSTSPEVEAEYENGVLALQRGDHYAASRHFSTAAEGGHVSAHYNLSLLWGGGSVTPYDFDLAADCWYKAAAAGHPSAQVSLPLLESADHGTFGLKNMATFARQPNPSGHLHPTLMICAARFYEVVCRKYGAMADVIAYKLDAAAKSDFDFVHAFIKRTGIDAAFYRAGLDRLKPGSAADEITDGLNEFHVAVRCSGISDKLAIMARCSIVGHIISKSPYGERAQPLLGTDRFFKSGSVHRPSSIEIIPRSSAKLNERKGNEATLKTATTKVGQQTRQYAGFWRRLAARSIDQIIIFILFSIPGAIIIYALAHGHILKTLQDVDGMSALLAIAANVLYFGWQTSGKTQATFGKRLLGMHVIRDDEKRLSLKDAFTRALATYLSLVTLGIGYLMAAFSKEKTALHDKICQTRVVHGKLESAS